MTQSPGLGEPPLYAQVSSSWLGRRPSSTPSSPPVTEEQTGRHAASSTSDLVNHPPHYRCPNPKYNFEVIQVIEAWYLDQDHYLANAIKYLLRAPFKGNPLQDVKKARWYLDRWITLVEEASL